MANSGNYFLGLSNHLAGIDPDDDDSTTPPPPNPSRYPLRHTVAKQEEVVAEKPAKEFIRPGCEKCGAHFSNKFNRDRHLRTCCVGIGCKNGEGEKEKRKVVEIKAPGVKCQMSDKPVNGTLVIPCSVYFKN